MYNHNLKLTLTITALNETGKDRTKKRADRYSGVSSLASIQQRQLHYSNTAVCNYVLFGFINL